MIGPPWPTANPPEGVLRIRDALHYQAGIAGAVFVDPIAERWFVGQPELIGADGVHPTDAGHAYMADKIAPLIERAIARALVNFGRASSLSSLIMKVAERLYRLLTPVLSLRVIVIVAALSVVVLVITLGAWVWFGVTNDQYSQLDRRLDSVSSLGDISTLLRTAQEAGTDQPSPNGGLVRTARIDGTTVSVPREIVLPQFDIGYANTTIDGVEYRVRTFAAGDALIAVGAPLADTLSAGSTNCTDECC